MFLHVGNDKNIREKQIIGIFDLDRTTVSPETRKFLSGAEKRGETESAVEEIPKSFVLYSPCENTYRVCFSQISSNVLHERELAGKENDI